ncbi:hypothetical protein [Amycolatopsis sp. EV170708-02-1]|uniref:hypothetical protein n=1 Tax=Amycolatopsis sp. EV170708-02-1 TaxID=2919322 RepID=UPI001F0C7E75|nr:hypothetical protein [Amycolatopsis sp. EV170708-02-1]UMP06704.1 hypothetical protein MJQ72_18680 [Amycolatopsis sp. EV170708-02-1]
MPAEYVLDCGDRTKVPAGEDDDELLSRYVWCDECRIWRRVIKQVDPADLDAEVGR